VVVMDRGGDSWRFFDFFVKLRWPCIIRVKGNRAVEPVFGGAKTTVAELVRNWPCGVPMNAKVRLPGRDAVFTLVACRYGEQDKDPVYLLVWGLKWKAERIWRSYRLRWGAEDGIRAAKQNFGLEKFLVRSWRAIRRLVLLVGLALAFLAVLWLDRPKRFSGRVRQAALVFPKQVVCLLGQYAGGVRCLLHGYNLLRSWRLHPP